MDMKDVFDEIREIYQDGVNKCDECGYSEKFKKSTEMFFDSVSKNWCLRDDQVHFEDIKFLDGYFIFGRGSNSVIHFRVKECPGWLFAIWWKTGAKDGDKKDVIAGDFFTQYEETIDKFKPSRSEMCVEITSHLNVKKPYCCCDEAAKIINFIKHEPHLAFCRDYCGWDYNTEYHSREEAKEKYDKYKMREKNKAKYTKIFNERTLSFVRNKILPNFEGAEIYDNGDNISPRYQVIAPYQKHKHIVDKPGVYALFDEQDEYEKALSNELDQIENKCCDYADDNDFLWFSPISRSIYFYQQNE